MAPNGAFFVLYKYLYRKEFMSKIKITSEQYKAILLREQQSRLTVSGDVLNENLQMGSELLEEGWKEVLLGVAMLMGVNLTGINQIMAQDALKNSETMSQIKSTLEDENKTSDLIKYFEEKGMKNPDILMAKNAENIKNKFNKVAVDNKIKYRVSDKVVDNLINLDAELAKGYALKKLEMSTDTIKGDAVKSIITIRDTIELELGNDNLFSSGGFSLNPDGVSIIKNTLDSIKNAGGRTISLNIESSTDAERSSNFKSEEDTTGNIKLASLRTKSVTDLVISLDDNINITHREIPNNGSDIVSTNQFFKNKNNKEVLVALRKRTSEYRYVKLKMVIEIKQEVPEENPKPEEIVKKYRFELSKVIITSNKRDKFRFKGKKVSCKKPHHHKENPIKSAFNCFTF